MHSDTQDPKERYKLGSQLKHSSRAKQVGQVTGQSLHYLVTGSPYKPFPQFFTHNLVLTKAKYGEGHCSTQSLATYRRYPLVEEGQESIQVHVWLSP